MRDKYSVIADIAKAQEKLRTAQSLYNYYEKAYVVHERECQQYIRLIDTLSQELAEIVQKESSIVPAVEPNNPYNGE